MKDLEKIVSRLILIDFQDPEFAAKYPFAGYILFHKDIDQSENGWKNLKEFNSYYIKLFRDKHNVNIFSAVDQEGGVVFRFDYPDFPAVFSQHFVKNQETAYKISKLNGLVIKYLGFNLNFSPVMDVNTNQNNPIIGARSFGNDYHLVAKLSFQYIKGYKDAGVLCTGKHFPGHGDTNVDSHLALPYSRVSFEHLYPFLYNKLFLPSIMTAHVVYRNVDYLPSTLSKKTLSLIDFNGLVFSDALNMKALNNYKWEDILINSILAGVDVLLILGDDKIKEESIKFLSKIAEKNDNFKQIVISKYLKINEFLQKYNIFTQYYNDNYILEEIKSLKSWMLSYELPVTYKGDFQKFKFLFDKFSKIIVVSNNYLKTIGINSKIKNIFKSLLNFKNEFIKANFLEINRVEEVEKLEIFNRDNYLIVNLTLDGLCNNVISKLRKFNKSVYVISFSNPYLEGDFVLNVGGFSNVHLENFKRLILKDF